jgi:hypothetical protein
MKDTAIRATIALASLVAGAIHFKVVPEHLEEFALFGAFFIALGAFQVLWAGAVMWKPNNLVLWSGVLVNLATIAIWIVSRTAGLPIGPEAGEAEAIGVLDAVSTALEAVVVLGGAYLLSTAGAAEPRRQPAWERERAA